MPLLSLHHIPIYETDNNINITFKNHISLIIPRFLFFNADEIAHPFLPFSDYITKFIDQYQKDFPDFSITQVIFKHKNISMLY